MGNDLPFGPQDDLAFQGKLQKQLVLFKFQCFPTHPFGKHWI
jgi:hypothetical protein